MVHGSNRLRVTDHTNLHAAYLHTRQPADACIALWSDEGLEPLRTKLPAELAAAATTVDAQLLLPTEESELTPLAAMPTSGSEENKATGRIAPGLWTIPALGIPLGKAVPWLLTLDAATQAPTLRLLAAASQLVNKLVLRGDFAPAPEGVLKHVPYWTT